MDLLNNPICENIELKFLVTNLLPDLKYLNRVAVKMDPNIYGYSQILPLKSKSQGGIPYGDTKSEDTFPQKFDLYPALPPALPSSHPSQYHQTGYYHRNLHSNVNNGLSSEDSSWNQGLPGEHLGVILHQGIPISQQGVGTYHTGNHHYHQQHQHHQHYSTTQQKINRTVLNDPNIDLISIPEELDSAPRPAAPYHTVPPPPPPPSQQATVAAQTTAPAPNSHTSPQSTTTRKSRLPWRNPPNPLPRNWNETNQSVVSSVKKRKLSTQSTDQSFHTITTHGQNTNHKTNLLQSFDSFDQQPPVEQPTSSVQKSHSSGSYPVTSQSNSFHQPRIVEDQYGLAPETEAEMITNLRRSNSSLLNHSNISVVGSQAIFSAGPDPLSSSTILQDSVVNGNNRNSKWLSPELNRKERSRSPEANNNYRHLIALPLPSSGSPERRRRSPSKHHESPADRLNRSTSSERNPNTETRSSYLWKKANEEKLQKFEHQKEKELSSQAFISMTEKQEKILEKIRTEQQEHHRKEKELLEESMDQSVKQAPTTTNIFERLNKQTLHHMKRSSSRSKSVTISNYTEKYTYDTQNNITNGTASVASSKSHPTKSDVSSSTTASLIPLEKFIPAKEKEEAERKKQEEEKKKKDAISPYSRFLRLKEKIDDKYDHDIRKMNQLLGVEVDEQSENSSKGGGRKSKKSNYSYLKNMETSFTETNVDQGETGGDEYYYDEEPQEEEASPLRLRLEEFSLASQQQPPSVQSYSSTMMSLDSLGGKDFVSSLRSVPHALLDQNNPNLNQFEREALRLSQELEFLKMKKLHELSTNKLLVTDQSIQDFHSPVYQQQKTPVQVLQEVTQTQQQHLTHHMEYIQEMLKYNQNHSFNDENVANNNTNNSNNNNNTYSNSSGDLRKTTTNQKEKSIPDKVFNSSNPPVNSVVFPSTAFLPMQQSSSNSRTILSHIQSNVLSSSSAPFIDSPTTTTTTRNSALPKKKNASEENIDLINHQFDQLQIDNLNFIEMNAAIESLKRNQLNSLERLHKQ